MRATLRWLLLLTAGQRLLVLWLLRPGGFFYDYSDYTFFRLVARLAAEGFYPFVHYWMEYPPLFPLANVGLYRLSLLIPTSADPRLWHHWLLGVALLPFDLLTLWVLARLAALGWGRRQGLWVASVWPLLFIPLYIWTGWFDTIPLALFLLALWLIIQRRPGWAGIVMGLGLMTKLIPLLVLPVAVQRFREAGRPFYGLLSAANLRMVAATGAVTVLLSLPFVWINTPIFLAMVRSLSQRRAWETVWALLDGYYSFGVVSGDRFNPQPTYEGISSHPLWLVVSVGIALFGLWAWTRPWDWIRPRTGIAFGSLTLLCFFLWSKGWSPQFLVWVLPLVLLLSPTPRGVAVALLLSLVTGAEWLFFARWEASPWILVVIVWVRTVVLIGLAVVAYRQLADTKSYDMA